MWFKKLDFIRDRLIVKFHSLYDTKEQNYKIVSAFLVNTLSEQDDNKLFEYHNYLKFYSKEEFEYFYDEIIKRSYFNTGITAKYDDQFLTLSTCAPSEFEEARWVIVARKVRKGESLTYNKEKVVLNKDKYMPLEWYRKRNKHAPR